MLGADGGTEEDSRGHSEKAMVPQSRTLSWKVPWMEEPGRLQSVGSQRVTQQLHFHFSLSCIGEGNGNPLQCSCLENTRGGGAWWAAVCGVAQGRTRLRRLSSSRGSDTRGHCLRVNRMLLKKRGKGSRDASLVPL